MNKGIVSNLIVGIISGLIVAFILPVVSSIFFSMPSVSIWFVDGDINESPFIVPIHITASNTKRDYIYLVVNDGNKEWIQPGLGKGLVGSFISNAYLGKEVDDKSLRKSYTVFAVVVNKGHKEYQDLDRDTIKASSQNIQFYRTK